MRSVIDAIAAERGGPEAVTVIGAQGSEITVSWTEVHHRARRMASALAAVGVRRGSRVGLLGDTSLGLVTAVQATWLAGAAVTILPRPTDIGNHRQLTGLPAIVEDADLNLVIVDRGIAINDAELSTGVRVVACSDLERRAAQELPAEIGHADPQDLAVLQYTSGSTRNPRGVPVTHGHLAANLEAIKAAFNHGGGQPIRMMSWLPLFHDMGLIGFLTLPMSCGWRLVLQSPVRFALRPASWLEMLSRHRVTTTGAPSLAYRLMIPSLTAGMDLDLSRLRFMLCGGEPVDAAAMSRFAAAAEPYGLDPQAIVPAYGLAESTLAVTISLPGTGVRLDAIDPEALDRDGQATPALPGDQARRLVRLGRPVSGTRLRVVDPRTGEPASARQVGHIEIQGPSVVGHYWGQVPPPPDAWFRTGDLGYITDAEPDHEPDPESGGELVVCGREQNLLFACGRNVYPHDIEAAATEVPGVRAGGVAAFGVPGHDGDRLVVAVESRGVDPATVRRNVTAAVRDEVGLAPATVVALPVGRLPKTSSGKIRRGETRRQFLSGQLAARTERSSR
jgi:fatty-acyl-CoA synthase